MNRVTNILNRYTDLKEKHIATLTNQHSHKVSQFHKTLKANFGQNLAALQVNQPGYWLNTTVFNLFKQHFSTEKSKYICYQIHCSYSHVIIHLMLSGTLFE